MKENTNYGVIKFRDGYLAVQYPHKEVNLSNHPMTADEAEREVTRLTLILRAQTELAERRRFAQLTKRPWRVALEAFVCFTLVAWVSWALLS